MDKGLWLSRLGHSKRHYHFGVMQLLQVGLAHWQGLETARAFIAYEERYTM